MPRRSLRPLCAGLALAAAVGCQTAGPRTARIDRPGPNVFFSPEGRAIATESRDADQGPVRLASRNADSVEPTAVRAAAADRIPLPRTDVDAAVEVETAVEPPIGSF